VSVRSHLIALGLRTDRDASSMSLKVLVVDDASFVRDTIKRTLRQFLHELELHEAADGRRAISILKTQPIDLILSDWEMPEVSGEKLLSWVRSESKNRQLPFIMISSRGERDHIINAINAGVSDYLSKPFTADELQRKVYKQLNKIGYKASKRPQARDTGFASVDVLTGGNTEDRSVTTESETSPISPPELAKVNSRKKSSPFDGRAQLRFASEQCQLAVRELTLQVLQGFMLRPATMPTLFDQVVVDVESKDGKSLARLNAYIHSLQALENKPDTEKLSIVVRFVDNDPAKFEILSKLLAT